MSSNLANRITRPKYPLILKGGNSGFFAMLVQLGNDIMRCKIPFSKIGEIQIYSQSSVWWYKVFQNPDYLPDSNI